MDSEYRDRKKTISNKNKNSSSNKTEDLLAKGNKSPQEDGFRYDYDDSSDLN